MAHIPFPMLFPTKLIALLLFSIMGHYEEVGIIPRFCEELFGRLDQAQEDKENICVREI